MSRDYALVDDTPKGWKFRKKGPEHNVNVWGCEYYGWIFKHLGLPLEKYGTFMGVELKGFPRIDHEYKGESLKAVRDAIEKPDFHERLLVAIDRANHDMDYDGATPEEMAEILETQFFPLFKDPKAVAVASDYCEEYHV